MNFLIINGSPKGEYSITLQTALYIQKRNPKHTFTVLNASQQIRQFEKDFSDAASMIKACDCIIFAYPVYTFIVPSQLHRFIELMKLHMQSKELSDKFATQITTSKHFYDVTAHTFIKENCFDMGLKFINGLSADMDDLTHKKGQDEAFAFGKFLLWSIENNVYESPSIPIPQPRHIPVTIPQEQVVPSASEKKKSVALVTDLAKDDSQLSAMIERFKVRMPSYNIHVINIHDFPFKGGCISCFNCATNGDCIYKDGFSAMLRNKIQVCSAIVIAFSIKDHSMGSIFKTYDDRQFCNGHRTVTMGMPFGYLISGNLEVERNLQTIIEARAEVGGNFLAGVATDETNPDFEIDLLAQKLDYAIKYNYQLPSNFYGVGGMKIFRDLIWQMQGMMKADHKFYKTHSMYDFPQKKFGTMLAMYLVGALISNPNIKKKMGNKMNEGMIAPYKKVLDKI